MQLPLIPEDLRPINTMPVYEGVLERIVKEELIRYLNVNKIVVEQ